VEVGDGGDVVRPVTRPQADDDGERTAPGMRHAGADAGADAREDTLKRALWTTPRAPDKIRSGLE